MNFYLFPFIFDLKSNYSGTFLVPPAAAGEEKEKLDFQSVRRV